MTNKARQIFNQRMCKSICVFSFSIALFCLSAVHAETTDSPEELKDPVAVIPEKGMVPDSLVMWANGPNHSRYAIIADKGKRTLSVWEKKNGLPSLFEAHPMDMGKKEGDKAARGDHKTPEGIYFPQQIFEGPSLNFDEYGIRAFELDYPNFFDKRARKTGDGIWLHAIPDSKSLMRGSRGCVVVRNDIIQKLTPMIDMKKTPVIILDDAKYVTIAELKKRSLALKAWLETWRAAWASKDLDNYMKFYGDDFRAMNMNKKNWRRYKQGLNEKYSTISVKTINPVGFSNGKEAVLTFLQEYESDTLKDFGIKTLYLRQDGDTFTISGEQWRSASPELLAQVPQ